MRCPLPNGQVGVGSVCGPLVVIAPVGSAVAGGGDPARCGVDRAFDFGGGVAVVVADPAAVGGVAAGVQPGPARVVPPVRVAGAGGRDPGLAGEGGALQLRGGVAVVVAEPAAVRGVAVHAEPCPADVIPPVGVAGAGGRDPGLAGEGGALQLRR